MIKTITKFDQWLFLKINSEWKNPFFDHIMPFLREPIFWVPLYLFFILLLCINFKQNGGWASLFVIATVAITDFISSHILKPFFGRIRPCGDPEFGSNVHLLASYCGGNGSFPSSHATNHFGIAMFLFIILKPFAGKWSCLFFVWAAAICYAQIYVGVHYPTDILGGTILGCFLGWITGSIFAKKIGLINNHI